MKVDRHHLCRSIWKTVLVLLISGLIPGAGLAEQDEDAPDGRRFFLLAVTGLEDEDLIESIREYVQQQMASRVRVVRPDLPVDETLQTAADAARELVTDDVLALAVLVAGTGEEDHGILRYEDNLGVINAGALGDGDPDAETYERRLERAVLRTYGFLMGLTYNPDPFSVMRPYKTLEQLDKLGRNFSPPTTRKLQELVRDRGGEIVDSPYRMIPKP